MNSSMRATLLLAMVAMVRGFSLTSPRHLGGLQRAQVVMNVGDEAMLQDAVKEVFDREECKVDAETAEELASCMEGAPSEPFDYAGADVPKVAPMPGVVSSTKGAATILDECLVETGSKDEIDACKEAFTASGASVADVEEEGCEMIGETKDEVWFACKDSADSPGVECVDESFGTGGGPGILPQDGQKLCKAEKPK